MSWEIDIILERRGAKSEVTEYIIVESREEAETLLNQLELDIKTAGADDFVIVAGGRHRVSFLKQDFRRSRLWQRQESRRGG